MDNVIHTVEEHISAHTNRNVIRRVNRCRLPLLHNKSMLSALIEKAERSGQELPLSIASIWSHLKVGYSLKCVFNFHPSTEDQLDSCSLN